MPRTFIPYDEFTAAEARDIAEDQPTIVRQLASARAQLRWHRDHLKRILNVSPTGEAAMVMKARVAAAKVELERLQFEGL